MKKSIFAICVILLVLLSGCDVSEKSTGNTEHIHQWQEVSGEHARICTECREKQLKPEACDFVRTSCDQPAVCRICHAINDEVESHDWILISENSDCWSTTINYDCSKCNREQVIHGDSALPNHSWKEATADGKTAFSCTRCKESITFIAEIREFSYAQDLEDYKIGDPGVKHEHFSNWDIESEITGAIDAIVRAKFELTIEYDTISVFYDKTSDMRRVDFWTLNLDGNSQSVYVNGNGLTCYVVYGE